MRFKRYRLAALSVAGLGMLAALPAVAGASTKVGAKTLTPLQKGLQYYRGKTLTYIVSTNAGAAYDIEARSVAPAMAAILGATINVVNIPGGSGIQGQDTLAASPKNGLTFGFLNTGAELYDIIANVAGLNFNPARVDFLGGVSAPDHAMFVQTTSPFPTVAAMRTATAANPVTLLTDNGSVTSTEQQLFLEAFNIHARIIRGYTNSATQLAGFQRGDGQGAFSAISTFGALLVGGKATLVAQMFHIPSGILYAAATSSVPTVAQLAKQFPPKTKIEKDALAVLEALDPDSGEPWALPTNTPTNEFLALHYALQKALTSPSMRTTFAQQGHLVDYVDGPAAKQRYVTALALLQKYANVLALNTGIVVNS